MPFVVSSLGLHCGQWGTGTVHSLSASVKNMAFGMQQFGAALAAVKKRRYRRPSIEQLIYQLGLRFCRGKRCIRHGGDSQHDAGRSGETTRLVSGRGENMVGACEPCAPVIRLM